MSIERIAEFAENGDKHLDNLDVSQGFQQAEKPERQWFNYLLNDFSKKINQVIDGLSDVSFEFAGFAPKISALESNYADINSEITKVSADFKSADAQLQSQINSVGGGKFAYLTYAEMIEAAALPVEDPKRLPANSSIDIINDPDGTKNGTYAYNGTTFTKSAYDPIALSKTYTDSAKADTLKKVINGFDTKDLMVASPLVDGSHAKVDSDPTVGNNGDYKKTAGAWVKSAYDPLTQARAYTDTVKADTDTNVLNVKSKIDFNQRLVDSKISKNESSAELLELSDSYGEIYAKFDKKGHFHLSDIENGSVQDNIKNIPKKSGTAFGDVFSLEDDAGNIVIRISNEGDLYLPKINNAVQKVVNNIAPSLNTTRRSNNKLRFTDAVNKYLLNLLAEKNGYAAMPYNLLPSSYTITKSNIDLLKVSSRGVELSLDSPYAKDDEFVHPYIIECVGKIRGYRYILMINPFAIEAHENPVIYGSNDLTSFVMLDGFTQPLDLPVQGGFLSDSGFSYDPVRGEIIAYWRSTRTVDGIRKTGQWYSRTKDFLNWTPKVNYIPEVAGGETNSTISPSIIFNIADGLWYMYFMATAGNFAYRTAKEIEGVWSAAVAIPTTGFTPWHCEVKYIGDKFVCLLASVVDGNQYLGVSSDGKIWDICITPLFITNVSSLYKGSFLAVLDDDDNFYLSIFYTVNDSSIHRRLWHTTTNTITI